MRYAKAILLLLLVAAFVPYLCTCFFALPFADDFCFGWTASENIPFIQKFLNQYLHWNGRYTSDILVNVHPLITGNLLLYQLVSFVSILATPLVIFAFIKQWVDDKIDSAIAALFIALFYLCYLPNITDGVYWYIGLVNYHWGTLLFILQLTVIIKLLKVDHNRSEDCFSTTFSKRSDGERSMPPAGGGGGGGENLSQSDSQTTKDHILGPAMKVDTNRKLLLIFSLALLVIAIGFNEIGAALVPAYYLAALIYVKAQPPTSQNASRNLRLLLTHFLIALVASVFVVCSPGNFTRESVFADRFNIIHSFALAALQTIRFTARWVSSVPFIALSLLVMINAGKVHNIAIKKVHGGIWISLMLFTVFIAALIPYLATGILGQHRTMNYVLPFFLLLWICALISLSAHYGIDKELTPETTGLKGLVVAIVALLVMSLSANARRLEMDIWTGSLQEYKTEFMQRQSSIIQHPTYPIAPLSHIPNSFKIVDARSDTTWWVEKCMKHYYRETNLEVH